MTEIYKTNEIILFSSFDLPEEDKHTPAMIYEVLSNSDLCKKYHKQLYSFLFIQKEHYLKNMLMILK